MRKLPFALLCAALLLAQASALTIQLGRGDDSPARYDRRYDRHDYRRDHRHRDFRRENDRRHGNDTVNDIVDMVRREGGKTPPPPKRPRR